MPPRWAASAPTAATSIPTNTFGMAELGSHSVATSGTEEVAESGGGIDGRDGCCAMCCGSRRPNGCGLVLVLLLLLAVCTVTWEAIAAASDLGIDQRGTMTST